VSNDVIAKLPNAGISCICNLVAAIWTARHYDMDGATSSSAADGLDGSVRLAHGGNGRAARPLQRRPGRPPLRPLPARLRDPTTFRELTYFDRKALHNFKYFTWVEQQGKDSEELRALWDEDFWKGVFDPAQVAEWDRLIDDFNAATGVLKAL
jgi:cysteine synthase